MVLKEEVDSDDGSYELVDFDDISSNMDLSNDDSYDFLSSDPDSKPVLTEEKDSNKPTANEDTISTQINSVSHDSPNEDSGSQDLTKSDSSEKEDEEEEEEEEGEEDYYEIISPDSNNKGKKRKVMITAYEKYLKKEMKIKEVSKTHILHFLSAKSLFRCQVVCKEWKSWIASPFFTHSQSQSFSQTSGFFQEENGLIEFISLNDSHYGVPSPSLSFLPNKIALRSSCNGLLLCQDFNNDNEYYVCNPANKHFIKLPKPSYYHGKPPKPVLAFEPSSLNFEPHYQVICPFSVPGEEPILYFDIYDSKSKSWKTSDEICVDLGESHVRVGGFFANGVVFWETTCGKLLAFDLKNEIHSVQTVPGGGGLTKVNGELCYVKGHYCHSTRTCTLDVYVGGVMSLKSTMSFEVPVEFVRDGLVVGCRVLGNLCDDVVAVVLRKSKGHNGLFVYHVKDQKVQGAWVIRKCSKVYPYVNSLVSIAP